jgi:hypothetical protein
MTTRRHAAALVAALGTAAALAPGGAMAAGTTCAAVHGQTGYYTGKIKVTGGFPCKDAHKTIGKWLNKANIPAKLAGPTGWSCVRTKHASSTSYSCNPEPGVDTLHERIHFTLRFSP